MTDIPSYRYSHKGGEYDLSDINNIPNLVHEITLTHNDLDDNITEWGNVGLFRRCLVGVTEVVNYECMSGIHSNGSVYYIYDGFEPDKVPAASYRTVDVGGSARNGYISKVYWGEHGDMIPIEVSASSTTHYCDLGSVANSGWPVAMRSNYSAGGKG